MYYVEPFLIWVSLQKSKRGDWKCQKRLTDTGKHLVWNIEVKVAKFVKVTFLAIKSVLIIGFCIYSSHYKKGATPLEEIFSFLS
jgi:hypothetical protein